MFWKEVSGICEVVDRAPKYRYAVVLGNVPQTSGLARRDYLEHRVLGPRLWHKI
jgi:hypothetical protein